MTGPEVRPVPSGAMNLEEKVRSRVESLSYLPTTVAVAMKFVELGKDPDAEPAEYAKVISSDSSLSSKLLSLANSSWFGVRNKVTKPQTAVNLLGLGTVRTLAISYCLTGLHNDLHLSPEESCMFWSASLCKAAAARQYAQYFDKKLAEEAFTAGLFQDFAVPIMFAVAKDEYLPVFQNAQLDWQTRLGQERGLFNLDHAEMGRAVAQKLELPDLFVDAVAFHHKPDALNEMIAKAPLAEAIFVASLFPHSLDAWNHNDAEQLRQYLTDKLGPQDVQPTAFLEAVQTQFNQIYGFFEQGSVPETRLTELLQQATREVADNTTRLVGSVHELLQQAASTGQPIQQMVKQHSDLAEAVNCDSLTGALNRQGLDIRAADVLASASRYTTGLAVIYLDIDRFKVLNDTHGHAAGDSALSMVVDTIRRCVRQNDVVARLGGDEFVMLLSDCSQAGATAVADRIVSSVAGQPVSPDLPAVKITVSAGFLWLAKPSVSLDALIAAADRLMYQAKRAGGNRTCNHL